MMTATATTTAARTNRAPKGGAISTVNNRYYKGGQWMPCVADVALLEPAPLVGSSRQVAWADRLRAEALARKEAELAGLLYGMAHARKAFRPWLRDEYRAELAARHAMRAETSAAAWIAAR